MLLEVRVSSKLRVHSRWLVLTGSVCLLVFAWLANQAARSPKALAQSGSSVFGVEMNPVGATGGLNQIVSPQTYTS